MKLIASATLAIALAFGFAATSAAASEGCFICQSGGSGGCQQCSYGSKGTQDARKACEKRGCKIGGTKSCSTASNANTCSLPASSTPVTAALLCGEASKVNRRRARAHGLWLLGEPCNRLEPALRSPCRLLPSSCPASPPSVRLSSGPLSSGPSSVGGRTAAPVPGHASGKRLQIASRNGVAARADSVRSRP